MTNAPPLIYVAGPYRAATTWQIDRNITNARAWGAKLAKWGAYPVIPHSNTAHMDGAADDALWLAGTMELLRRCDGAIFIEGWKESRGSCAEWDEVVRLKQPRMDARFLSEPDIEEWVKDVRKTKGATP